MKDFTLHMTFELCSFKFGSIFVPGNDGEL